MLVLLMAVALEIRHSDSKHIENSNLVAKSAIAFPDLLF